MADTNDTVQGLTAKVDAMLGTTKVVSEMVDKALGPTKAMTDAMQQVLAPSKALAEAMQQVLGPAKLMSDALAAQVVAATRGISETLTDSTYLAHLVNANAGVTAMAKLTEEMKKMQVPALPAFQVPTFERQPLRFPDPPAKSMYDRLGKRISEFEKRLDPDHEVGAIVVAFMGDAIYIDDLGYHGPDMVIFYGVTTRNEPVELLQHYTQTSLMLVSLKKRHAQAKRIGFSTEPVEAPPATPPAETAPLDPSAPPGGR